MISNSDETYEYHFDFLRSSFTASELIQDKLTLQHYLQNTISVTRTILAAVVIRAWTDLKQLLSYANKNNLHLYIISTGNNWGYGCSLPVIDRCILVDLSQMKKIIAFDPETGILTIEPGVTQQMLYDYLLNHDLHYMVPTTGAGHNCSLIGNILERGFGLAPINDHGSSVISIQGFLGDGTFYAGSFPDECQNLESSYKHSIGGNISALFIQSNLCIVTSMSIQLVQKPQCLQLVTIQFQEKLIDSQIINFIKSLYKVVGRDHISNISLMHMDRFTKFNANYPDSIIDKLISSKLKDSHWLLFFTIYCNHTFTAAIKKHIKKSINNKVRFYDFRKLKFFTLLLKKCNYFGSTRIKQWFYFCDTALLAFSGVPTNRGLQLIYERPINDKHALLNPSLDQCGVFWCTLVLPLNVKHIALVINIVDTILAKYNIVKHLSFTSIDANSMLASIPLSYSKSNDGAAQNCYACYNEVIKMVTRHDIYPQRLSILSMPDHLPSINKNHWDALGKIKLALDPNNVISPGRYQADLVSN